MTKPHVENENESPQAIIERSLGLPEIGPGLDRERTLRAIDSALTRIEAVMASLGGPGPGLDGRFAFRQFMERLGGVITRLGGRVEVIENAAFIQVRSRVNGHRLYISKGKLAVGRVESTLPTEVVPGAITPRYHNGNIRSWIPVDEGLVARVIEMLGRERIP